MDPGTLVETGDWSDHVGMLGLASSKLWLPERLGSYRTQRVYSTGFGLAFVYSGIGGFSHHVVVRLWKRTDT